MSNLAEKYLNQAKYLDAQIKVNRLEIDDLREKACILRSLNWHEKVQTSPIKEAPFAHAIEKLVQMEKAVDQEIDKLVNLKSQIQDAINALNDPDEKAILMYRFLQNYTWEDIAKELHVASRTVRRWYAKAIKHVILPEDAIWI